MLKELEFFPVKEVNRAKRLSSNPFVSNKLDSDWIRNLCLESGADDVGFVEIERKDINDQREDILSAFPRTKTIVCLAHRINSDSVRTLARHVANAEFKHVNNQLLEVTRRIMAALEHAGVRGIRETGIFPMNADAWPGKMFIVSLKPMAVAAGLGRMGFNRMILHPQFGTFINISALLIDKEVTDYSKPIENNPCLNCKLCASTCPTGAIANDGYFNFSSCLTHNYREKLGGFSYWVENIVKSKSAKEYRKRVSDQEIISMWQSLSYGANSKCDYCMAVCPAGNDVSGLYNNPKEFVKEIVKPFQEKQEKIYVVPGSDAELHVTNSFPHKTVRRVGNGLRADSIRTFLNSLPLIFQRNKSEGLNATFHFTFTGKEETDATIVIENKTININKNHIGEPDIHVIADTVTWLKFLAKEQNIIWSLFLRKIRVKGSLRLLSAFGKCFPI